MPKNSIRFEVLGDWGRLKKLPEATQEVLTNFEDLYEDAVFPWMLEHTTKVWATQGKAAGEKWQDYSNEPAYAWYKASLLDFGTPDDLPVGRNTTGGLLRWKPKDNERLFPSLTEESHAERVADVDGASAEWGTSVPWAQRLAQEGGSGPFGESYPPRPILSLSEPQEKRLRVKMAQYYCQKLKQLGYDIECTEQTVFSLAGVT